jgi:hypothetical protein
LSVACARAAVPLRATSLSMVFMTKALRASMARLSSVGGGVAFDQHLAGVVGDARDQVGVDAVAAVGEHRKAGGHLHRRDRAGAQRHGQVGRVLVGSKPKRVIQSCA